MWNLSTAATLHDIGNKTVAVKMDNHSTISTYCNFDYIKLMKALLKSSYTINNFPTLQFESVYTLPTNKNPPMPCVQSKKGHPAPVHNVQIRHSRHTCAVDLEISPQKKQSTQKVPTPKTLQMNAFLLKKLSWFWKFGRPRILRQTQNMVGLWSNILGAV